MYDYYEDRMVAQGFWYDDDISKRYDRKTLAFILKENAAKPTLKMWLNPWAFCKAVDECHLAAGASGRAAVANWLWMGSPGLVALCLRDIISPACFKQLWGGTEDVISLAVIDTHCPPVFR
jgi:hypothetical protein